jgi:hypothetical protein
MFCLNERSVANIHIDKFSVMANYTIFGEAIGLCFCNLLSFLSIRSFRFLIYSLVGVLGLCIDGLSVESHSSHILNKIPAWIPAILMFFVVLLSPSREMLGYYLKEATTTFFHIFPIHYSLIIIPGNFGN